MENDELESAAAEAPEAAEATEAIDAAAATEALDAAEATEAIDADEALDAAAVAEALGTAVDEPEADELDTATGAGCPAPAGGEYGVTAELPGTLGL